MNNDVYYEMIVDEAAVHFIDEEIEKALLKTADFIRGDAVQRQVIPFDYGFLQRNTLVYKDLDGNASIEHLVPYAHRMYYGDNFNFQTVNNAHAQSRWYKDYDKNGTLQNKVEDFFANEIRNRTARYTQ